MNHLRTVQTRNVVVSNVMMSNAPKMTCPGDPRAQTHTQIVRAYLRFAANKRVMGKRYAYYFVYNRLNLYVPTVHEMTWKYAVEEKMKVPF